MASKCNAKKPVAANDNLIPPVRLNRTITRVVAPVPAIIQFVVPSPCSEEIIPRKTIQKLTILKEMGLTDEQFNEEIHHCRGSKGKNESIQSHLNYLTGRTRYKKGFPTRIVALRIYHLHWLTVNHPGSSLQDNITSTITSYVFDC